MLNQPINSIQVFITIFYVIPFSISIIYTVLITFKNYQKDLYNRAFWELYLKERNEVSKGNLSDIEFKSKYPSSILLYEYSPTDTIGEVLKRLIMSISPGFNLFLSVHYAIPFLFENVFKWFSELMEIPLVKSSTVFFDTDDDIHK